MVDHAKSHFIDQLLGAYVFNLAYARDLVSDVSGDMLYTSPGAGLENTPGFTLGHLVIASAMIAEDLGAGYTTPDGWDALFMRKGPGDPRLPQIDHETAPTRDELIYELAQKHAQVEALIRNTDSAKLNEPLKWRFSEFYPTVGGMLQFMCVTHEAMHLAQVAAWRRAHGMESSLGRL